MDKNSVMNRDDTLVRATFNIPEWVAQELRDGAKAGYRSLSQELRMILNHFYSERNK